MMKIKHITHDVDIIIDINKMVAEEWFGKEMYRVVLITTEGEEVSRIFSKAELEDLKEFHAYVEHKAVDSKFA